MKWSSNPVQLNGSLRSRFCCIWREIVVVAMPSFGVIVLMDVF